MKTPEQIVAAWREGCRHCLGGDYACSFCLSDAIVALELLVYAQPMQKGPPPAPPEPFPDDDPFLPKRLPGPEHGGRGPGGLWPVVLVGFLGGLLMWVGSFLGAWS